MVSRNMTISIPSGLEARPIALLVQVASRYDSKILIESGDKTVNAKSIMGMMTLGLSVGESVTVSAEGSDENDAIAEIEKYLNSNN